MKNYQQLFLLAITLIAFSCSKDDEKPSIDESLLPGTWEINELDYSGTTSTTALGLTTDATFIGTMIDSNVEVIFTTDPDEFESSGSYTIDLETTTMGQTMTTQTTVPGMMQDGNWSIEGDIMKITNAGSVVEEAKILELTATTLVLQLDSETSIDLNDISSLTELHVKYRLAKR